jgi:radical SAM protein
MRPDIWDLIGHAHRQGVPTALSPSATELLDDKAVQRIRELGVAAVSLSLDGPNPQVHDGIRLVPGTFERTLAAARRLQAAGVKLQINTAVMRRNVESLADLAALLVRLGVRVWEVFYLVPVGRAGFEEDLSPEEWEDVSHFLYEASRHGLLVRTVEGPMFRRVAFIRQRLEEEGLDPDQALKVGDLYHRLKARLTSLLGEAQDSPHVQTQGTRDGRGILFIAYNGDVYPSGFLPKSLGNVRRERLAQIYRGRGLLQAIRRAEFGGRCGRCEFRDLCGGSRARAYAYYQDPLAEDPACPYQPEAYATLTLGDERLPSAGAGTL